MHPILALVLYIFTVIILFLILEPQFEAYRRRPLLFHVPFVPVILMAAYAILRSAHELDNSFRYEQKEFKVPSGSRYWTFILFVVGVTSAVKFAEQSVATMRMIRRIKINYMRDSGMGGITRD